MKIDLYHLYRYFDHTRFVHPIVPDVLKVWAESIGCEVRVSVCKEAGVNLSTDADVVAISVYTQTAPAAYRLSEKLRRRGKVVILGGPHFRGSNHQEAFSRCDVIAESICEEQWKSLLHDFEIGKIAPNREKALYIKDKEGRFHYPNNLYESFKNHKWYQISTIPTSIGCPYNCEYCSPYLQGKYILRDIQTVYNEITHIRGKLVFICDATFGLNKKYTIELMNTIASLEKHIVIETTLSRLLDKDILNALADGGVKWIVAGIETLSTKLTKHGSCDSEGALKQVIDNAHERGMVVHGNFLVGLDWDGLDCFDRIYKYYENSNLDMIVIGVVTPYPNTELYHRLQNEGRIIDTNWEHYDGRHIVFRPRNMTVDQLINGYIQLHHSVNKVRFLYDRARQAYTNNGITSQSIAMIGYNLLKKFEVSTKAKALRINQKHIAVNS